MTSASISLDMLGDDLVLPFQLEAASIRGRLVRMGPCLDKILAQHAYPDPVALLLGEAMVVATALASNLKYEGLFTLQARTEGAVRILVCDVLSDGGLRGYAHLKEGGLVEGETDPLLGDGLLAFTVDQDLGKDKYQGIVKLDGGTISSAVQHYFRQSEQLPTAVMAAVGRDPSGAWRGGCLLLQKMPREGGHSVLPTDTAQEDDWLRVMALMQTLTQHEMLDADLPATDLLYRLFNQDQVRVYDPKPLRHQCRCSEERVVAMLRTMPRQEIESMAVNGVVDVVCEFCNRSYPFDTASRHALYAANNNQPDQA